MLRGGGRRGRPHRRTDEPPVIGAGALDELVGRDGDRCPCGGVDVLGTRFVDLLLRRRAERCALRSATDEQTQGAGGGRGHRANSAAVDSRCIAGPSVADALSFGRAEEISSGSGGGTLTREQQHQPTTGDPNTLRCIQAKTCVPVPGLSAPSDTPAAAHASATVTPSTLRPSTQGFRVTAATRSPGKGLRSLEQVPFLSGSICR